MKTLQAHRCGCRRSFVSGDRPRAARRLRCLKVEPLEDRRLLSALGQEQAVELLSTSPALFVAEQRVYDGIAVGAAAKAPGWGEQKSQTSSLALAEVEGLTGWQVVMPMAIELGGAEVYAVDVVLTYDDAELAVQDVVPGDAASGTIFVVNTTQPGIIRAAVAATELFTQDGTLLEITFDVIGPLGSPTEVCFASAMLDEGADPVTAQDGAVYPAVPAEIKGQHLFYNNSFWDTASAENPEFDDDTAVAPDKVALLPGAGQATFDNYTSYVRGLNGIVVDVVGLRAAEEPIDPANYFAFKVGNDDTPADWAPYAVVPTGDVRPGEGQDFADRITLVWPDYDPNSPETTAVAGQWLEVTVLANRCTGLAEPQVFYFGNAIGETGDSTLHARVDANDILQTRNNPHAFFDPAAIDCNYDFDRDARVDAYDLLLVRNNQTTYFDDLELITVPGKAGKSLASAGDSSASARLSGADGCEVSGERVSAHDAVFQRTVAQRSARGEGSVSQCQWLYQYELPAHGRLPRTAGAAAKAVDMLLDIGRS